MKIEYTLGRPEKGYCDYCAHDQVYRTPFTQKYDELHCTHCGHKMLVETLFPETLWPKIIKQIGCHCDVMFPDPKYHRKGCKMHTGENPFFHVYEPKTAGHYVHRKMPRIELELE